MGRLRQNLALLLASVAGVLVLLELGLRLFGYRFDIAPESVEFGWPDPAEMQIHFEPDPDLFWVPEGYGEFIADLRLRGVDVVLLGDSCTATGEYPALLARHLRSAYPGRELRAVKLGVPGWSSYQGRRQLERDLLAAGPRIVTFYFGWNDHWIGFGVEDREVYAALRTLDPVRELRVA
jgi:hypothetical protein